MPRLGAVAGAVGLLAIVSLFVGVGDVTPAGLWDAVGGGSERYDALLVLTSRLPRTIAIVLAGAGLAIAGQIMQLLSRNRFVEPSTAALGILAVTVLAPGAPVMVKMLAATLAALAGTALFLRILHHVPLRSPLVVPLVGLMLGGVVNAVSTFFAYRLDLLQSLNVWMTGDFSGVLRGRYELLWLTFALVLLAYLVADRFTLAGMGQDFVTTLGMSYRSVMALGLAIVAMVTAVVVVTVGAIPFLGLVVPNLVAMIFGDNLRRTAPLVALGGAAFVLVCDLVGRTVRYPYEVPIGVVVGVVGSALFLTLLLRRGARVA